MKKILSIIVALLLGGQISPIIGQAEESMAYSVKANIPENQINKTLTYFDLKMEPGQEQEISLTVSNSSDKEASISISPNIAMTNQNGVIDYSQFKPKLDSTLEIPLNSIISGKQDVTLAPNETKQIPFTIKMPEKAFEGIILGGFYISKETINNSSKEEKDVQIKNNYSYVIGIQLRESLNEVTPELKLNKIKPALLNYRTAVTANLQNTEATLIKGLNVHAKIWKKGSSKILHEIKKTDLSMAPNSNFDFPISWDNQILEAGSYTLKLEASSGEHKWNFEEDFMISAKESRSLNKEAVELEKKDPDWFMIIVIVALITLIGIILISFFIYKYKKKKEAERQARLKKQRKRKKMQAMKRKQMANKKKKELRDREKINEIASYKKDPQKDTKF